jgi:heme/copper-type cytochrome/quinol oxidase subunit 2
MTSKFMTSKFMTSRFMKSRFMKSKSMASTSRTRVHARGAVSLALLYGLVLAVPPARGQSRVIELVADKDSRYKMAGKDSPSITVKAGEAIVLRITARRGKSWNRDGSIHGFSLLRAKDRSKVSGWDLLLKPGTEEFQLTAPTEAGDYEVVCTVICSEDHEGMHMKFVVEP